MLFCILNNITLGDFVMKLKIRNLNKLIDKLSGREIDLFLYLIKRQNEFGQVDGIRYKETMLDLHMPKSTFYKCLNSLEKNKFIIINWGCGYGEFDLLIMDNMFIRDGDYKEGYLSLNLDFISSLDFINLNVSIKKFALKLLSMQAKTRKVRITNEMLKEFKVLYAIEELKKIFKIVIIENAYLFTLREELLEKTYNTYFLQYKQKLITYCRKYRIAYTMIELIDSIKAIITYTKKNKANRINLALDYIRGLHILQPKLITHMCTR